MEEEIALVNAVIARQQGSFEMLTLKYQKLVWHTIFKMVKDQEDTRELSQETFIRIYLTIQQFRFEGSLSAWIARIAFSMGTRHLKKKPPLISNTKVTDLVSKIETEATVVNADLRNKIEVAIRQLPKIQSLIVTLYHFNDLGINEISTICDMPSGTVKSHLFRARRKLRVLIHPNTTSIFDQP